LQVLPLGDSAQSDPLSELHVAVVGREQKPCED
jgi:hypothetical protein